MTKAFRPARWLMAPALLLATCSQGPARTPTNATDPLNTIRSGAGSSGVVTGSAAGDVQNGPIEIFNVRVAPTGGNRFYANPGGVYRVDPNVPVEFWVEWRSNVALANPPRLIINWGFTEAEFVSCGSCLLNRAFPEGLHTVTVTLDDRVGGTTKRTFQIDTRPISEQTGVTHPLFANGGGYACPNPSPFIYTPPLDPSSSVQAKAACEACYGVGACYLESADCAGLGWGPRPPGQFICGQAYFGFANGCSGSDGRAWGICNSFTTFGYWGRF